MTPRAHWYALAAIGAAAVSVGSIAMRPDSGNTAAGNGALLFRLKGCATCHDGPGSASLSGAGPSLAAAPTWAADRVTGMTAEEYLAQSIRTPSAFIAPGYSGGGAPGAGQMPLLRLSDDEVDAIVDFLLGRSDDGPQATAPSTTD